eukprot:gene2344-biopygen11027
MRECAADGEKYGAAGTAEARQSGAKSCPEQIPQSLVSRRGQEGLPPKPVKITSYSADNAQKGGNEHRTLATWRRRRQKLMKTCESRTKEEKRCRRRREIATPTGGKGWNLWRVSHAGGNQNKCGAAGAKGEMKHFTAPQARHKRKMTKSGASGARQRKGRRRGLASRTKGKMFSPQLETPRNGFTAPQAPQNRFPAPLAPNKIPHRRQRPTHCIRSVCNGLPSRRQFGNVTVTLSWVRPCNPHCTRRSQFLETAYCIQAPSAPTSGSCWRFDKLSSSWVECLPGRVALRVAVNSVAWLLRFCGLTRYTTRHTKRFSRESGELWPGHTGPSNLLWTHSMYIVILCSQLAAGDWHCASRNSIQNIHGRVSSTSPCRRRIRAHMHHGGVRAVSVHARHGHCYSRHQQYRYAVSLVVWTCRTHPAKPINMDTAIPRSTRTCYTLTHDAHELHTVAKTHSTVVYTITS